MTAVIGNLRMFLVALLFFSLSLAVCNRCGHQFSLRSSGLPGRIGIGKGPSDSLMWLWIFLGSGRTHRVHRVPGPSGGRSVMPSGDA